MRGKRISAETLIALRNRLELLPPRSKERQLVMKETACTYGLSISTLRRSLRKHMKPRPLRRSDYDKPRVIDKEEMERYCELIAAIKVRTSNKKGRHLSTPESIRLLEEYGVETPTGLVQVEKGLLSKTTVNRYLLRWKWDYKSTRVQPVVVHFEAQHSNECWQFDLSTSDLKIIQEPPPWIDRNKGHIQLMLFSVVDDKSGVSYQEYRCVYGEDAASALRFLFNAMSPKTSLDFPFHGIPGMIYLDNGPIAKSRIFQKVMEYLGVTIQTHLPKDKDGRRVTARSKGKVERPFRTVKEIHETLYHFHAPKNEEEANAWLCNYLQRYNQMDHRSAPHPRLEDWMKNIPASGIREMCSWERFCSFAREAEQRKVASDATVSVDGVSYQVSPELAGKAVTLWWGLFDQELYVDDEGNRTGPYYPVKGPIPLHQYRAHKKTRAEKKADVIDDLAQKISIPRSALAGITCLTEESCGPKLHQVTPSIAFTDFDPFSAITYKNIIEAKRAISGYLGKPLAKLTPEQIDFIDTVVNETLEKEVILKRVQVYFKNPRISSLETLEGSK